MAGKRRIKDEADLDITPMIDIVFLLLIFFMVTSNMESQDKLDIPPAKHGIGVDGQNAVFVSILKSDKGCKYVCKDGDGPEVTVEEAAEYVNTKINEGKTDIIIKADRDVSNQNVFALSRLITAENVKLFVAVRDQED